MLSEEAVRIPISWSLVCLDRRSNSWSLAR